MERLPAQRTTGALARKGDSLVMWSARQLGRQYRGTRTWVIRYRQSEVALYNNPSVVIDASLLGSVIYLLTCAPLLVALMTFGLLVIVKVFYYLGHSVSTEVGALPSKFAARVLLTINLIILAAITTLVFVSRSPFKDKAYLVLVGMLIVETISVLTWYTRWALRDQERNMRDVDYERVVHRTGRRYVIGALFVIMQAFVFAFLA